MKYSILSLILSICILSCETYDPAKQAVKTNTTTSTTTGTGTTGTGTTDTGTGTTGTGTTGTTGTGTAGTGTTGTGTTTNILEKTLLGEWNVESFSTITQSKTFNLPYSEMLRNAQATGKPEDLTQADAFSQAFNYTFNSDKTYTVGRNKEDYGTWAIAKDGKTVILTSKILKEDDDKTDRVSEIEVIIKDSNTISLKIPKYEFKPEEAFMDLLANLFGKLALLYKGTEEEKAQLVYLYGLVNLKK
ncbi:MAG: hypothetical protein KA327_05575 [Pseudarcicella sp.]|nr:hypothetical protein [Pseudarcicella sp.]